MAVPRFARWCSRAVGRIRFRPDRKEAYAELYAHMEDQFEELTAAGYSEAEAEEQVAAAMGDAEETARQLELIHRPFWGYALWAARCCLILAALLALLTLPGYIRDLGIDPQGANDAFFAGDREDGQSMDLRVFYAEPGSRDRSDGYTFTLTRAAERSLVSKTDGEEIRNFYLEVEVFDPRPWADACTALTEFYALDSLGNTYCSAGRRNRPPYLTAGRARTGLFTWTWTIVLRSFRSAEADWLELRYDQSGRHLRLTLDLRERKEAAP